MYFVHILAFIPHKRSMKVHFHYRQFPDKELRFREDKWLAQSHTASKLQTQNFDLNLFDAQSCIILGTCFPGGSDGK